MSVQLQNLPTHFQKFRMDPAILKVYRILSKVVASTLSVVSSMCFLLVGSHLMEKREPGLLVPQALAHIGLVSFQVSGFCP